MSQVNLFINFVKLPAPQHLDSLETASVPGTALVTAQVATPMLLSRIAL